eukprot:207981-Rhodomonas_salina.2
MMPGCTVLHTLYQLCYESLPRHALRRKPSADAIASDGGDTDCNTTSRDNLARLVQVPARLLRTQAWKRLGTSRPPCPARRGQSRQLAAIMPQM